MTQRAEARRVQYITGHGRDGRLPDDLDWVSLADPAVTTVVYMPAKTLPELAVKAIASGLDASTPAVAVARATRPDEIVIADRIAELHARIAAEAPSGPIVVMIGRVFADHVAARLSSPERLGLPLALRSAAVSR
jgi:uroporphyrin-III C-methyltransferase/precorrin-2 dehydrogenase/sirohydrochlorin ferrochelatase